jgi:hypothetical protein
MGNALAGASAVASGAGSTGAAGDPVNEYVVNAARKRYGYIVEPVRVISWDHAKLLTKLCHRWVFCCDGQVAWYVVPTM